MTEPTNLELGSIWTLRALVTDPEGDPADAGQVRLTITGPDNVVVLDGVLVTPTETGVYDRDFVPTTYGWWRADWVATGANASAHTEWVYVRRSVAWMPTPDQVHALIPVRPRFTAMSRPSVAEVQDLISMTADAVAGESSTNDFLPEQAGKVRFVIALHVASQIESQYFPEQQTGPDSPGADLYARYQGELLGLRTLVSNAAGPVVC